MSDTIRDTLAIIEAYKAGSDFDPHALAMALQLADLLQSDVCCNLFPTTEWDDSGPMVSLWLRREVQRELESQP